MDSKWTGNNIVFRTYVKGNPKGDGKKPIEKVKGRQVIRSFEDASQFDCFGGVLNPDIVDISFDTDELSEMVWNICGEEGWKTLVLENPDNGHLHFFFRDSEHRITKSGADVRLALGIIADIHHGDTYIPLRVKGSDRFPPSQEDDDIQEVPVCLLPIQTDMDSVSMGEGDGRNDLLLKIQIPMGQTGMKAEDIRHTCELINRFIFKKSLSEEEFNVVLREDAVDFAVENGKVSQFFKGKTFLHNVFAEYLMKEYHIKKIGGRIHIYQDGIYHYDMDSVEHAMVKVIPTLADSKRKEVLKYLKIVCQETETASPELIAFRNGVLDIQSGEMIPFSPDMIITNRIPWNYVPDAEDSLTDATLNRIACDDPDIRSLLEECIGYCFFRENRFNKAFILIGDKSNGKSTFISVLNRILGDDNVSALDLKNLGDRFSKATLFKKLANIGDDISDEFIPDSSLFKKITDGNRIQAEYKGQDAFEFNPYVKLVFSANNMPRIRDKTGAVQRRLEIIPFQAVFSEDDPDFDPDIKSKLFRRSSIEYLIRIGVDGLQRLLEQKKFTKSVKVQKELDEYEVFNNPVLGFFKEQDEGYLFKNDTKTIYLAYSSYCQENGYTPESSNQFGRTVKSLYGVESKQKTVNRQSVRMYVKISE